MEIITRKVQELTPYAQNTKKHDQKQIDNVANSIKRFGWQQPIVIDEQGVVVIGHCRLLAAKKLGLKEVPVTVASGLTDEEIRELRIADNKTNESPWDFDILPDEIADLNFDGFDFSLLEEKKEKEKEIPGEVEFSEVIGEENNYVVLLFKTDIDWLNARSLLDIGVAKAHSTRKDGKITDKMERKGTARVLDGAEVLRRLFG